MGTVYQTFTPDAALFQTTAFPQLKTINGTNYPVMGLYYDGTVSELAYWQFKLRNYGAGVDMIVTLDWYADTAVANAVVWEAALAAITPDADTQDVETRAFGTAATVTDTHLTTTGQRLHTCSITLTGSGPLNSAADGDACWMRIARLPANAADGMAGDAVLIGWQLAYSDT
ncbi:hypothetical protein GCM10017559_08470 [Streptosporangium longisporum]|uniref:Uncharacterized protein n=1 Tax=Streptosporangium longisporum TaxID=46187 RepID=A0ABP6KB98_9ACTN